jgi:rRNA maturation RNase YbeY
VNRQRLVKPRRELLESLLGNVLTKEGVPGALCVEVTLLRDRTIRPVNRDYLGRDRPTDVLAFPYIKPGEWRRKSSRATPVSLALDLGMNLLGDVLISADQALVMARGRRVHVHNALAHLAIHGLLHLLGYDHKRDAEARVMRRLERRYLGDLTRSRKRRFERHV